MLKVEVQGIGKFDIQLPDGKIKTQTVINPVVNSFFLTTKEITRIGTEAKCMNCKETFTIGKAETDRAMLDDKLKPKKTVEVWAGDSVGELAVKELNISEYTLQECAIIFGVQAINTHLCPKCTGKNLAESDCSERTFFSYTPNRRYSE